MRSCLLVEMHAWILVTVVFFSFISCQSDPPTSGTVTITLPGDIVVPPVVSVKEGDKLRLLCRTDIANSSILWTKPGSGDFFHNADVLYLERVLLDHGGEYVCSVMGQSGGTVTNLTGVSSVHVNVLYGPGIVTITGPNSALTLETLELKCSSSGNPQPSYLWSSSYTGLPVLQRGPVLVDQLGGSDAAYYCFAENNLIPTQGNSTTSSAVAAKIIYQQREAMISDLYNDYKVNEGDRLDISCRVSGVPQSRSWWTRAGDEAIISEGGRLLVPNVTMDFDGYYSCHAQNIVTHTTGVERTVTHYKNTYIQINPKGTSFSDEVCSTKCNVTSDKLSLQPTIKEHCNHAVIAALVIGWIVVVILILIVLFYCIRIREAREILWNKHHTSEEQFDTSMVLPSVSEESPKRRDLPKRPRSPERLEIPNWPVTTRKPESPRRLESPKRPVSGVSTHTYLALDGSTSDRGTPDGNHSTPVPAAHDTNSASDFGYITAKFSTCDNAGYEKPIASPETKAEANNEAKKQSAESYEA